MEDAMQLLVAVGGLFVLIGFVADSIGGALVRRKVADKELSPDQIDGLLKRRADPDSALKWGLVAVAVGIGFVVLQFLPQELQEEPFAIGMVLILAGAGLFLYRTMVRN